MNIKHATIILLSSILAASPAAAEMLTGDWGRRMMYGGGPLWMLFSSLFFVGLFLLVWLLVIKLWRELYQRKK